MKKKAKLIATLSSLGLSLAMLVFAVYAATSVTFKVTTNVSFKATKHVQATIVAKDTGKLASAPTNASYTVPAKTGGNQTIGVNPDGTDNGAVTDVEFVGAELDATNKYYGYQITITNNDNENKLPVTVTIPEHTGTGYTVTYKVNGTKVNAGENVVEVPENKDGQNNVYVITCDVVITDLAGNAITINEDHLNIEKVFLGADAVVETYLLDVVIDCDSVQGGCDVTSISVDGNTYTLDYNYSVNIPQNKEVTIVLDVWTIGPAMNTAPSATLYDTNDIEIDFTLKQEEVYEHWNGYICTYKFMMSSDLTLDFYAGVSDVED